MYQRQIPRVYVPGQPAKDPERARVEAGRRARSKLRRYCVANGLNRFGTLTYDGTGCHSPRQVRQDVGGFFRELRERLGGKPLPYVWVPEWHKAHGLHLHFALGRFVHRSLIEAAWGRGVIPGRGFIHIKLASDLPVGSMTREESRRAAGYLSKYVAKSFEDGRRVRGLHRYEVAQGFQPVGTRLWARSSDDLLAQACDVMGARPIRSWSSAQAEEWQGPPAVWFAWA